MVRRQLPLASMAFVGKAFFAIPKNSVADVQPGNHWVRSKNNI
jgi:hypothetical protein